MRLYLLAAASLVLASCSSSESSNGRRYGMIDNARENVTIVSIGSDVHSETTNVGETAKQGAAATATNAAGSAVSGLSSTLSPLGNLIGSSGSAGQTNSIHTMDVETLTYVVRTDDGRQLTVTQDPDENEMILYPGQRAIIQFNGKYVRIYPADIEHQRSMN